MRNMILSFSVLLPFFFGSSLVATEERVPLRTELPAPSFHSGPVSITITNMEPGRLGTRPDFMVPAGTKNLAKGKIVIASDDSLATNKLSLVTDGNKSGDDSSCLQLGPGKQWVQIDVGRAAEIYAVLVWHFYATDRVYFDVAVQISNDPKFEHEVTTIFNNDTENNLGLGKGRDFNYLETYEGKLIDAKGVKGRYVRLYTNGNTSNDSNHYVEVEVFGGN